MCFPTLCTAYPYIPSAAACRGGRWRIGAHFHAELFQGDLVGRGHATRCVVLLFVVFSALAPQ